MHMFQKHILDELRTASQLRYSEMQPDGVESSHFKYHLDQLLKDNLVEKTDRGIYALTGKGKAAVDRLSVGRINPHMTPKVITYTLLHDRDDYYLFRKDKEPFRDKLNMISGKVHMGERTVDAAVREVNEKVHLEIEPPQLKIIAEIRIREGETLLTHIVAYVYLQEYTGDCSLLEKVPKGELETRIDLAPDLLPIIEHVTEDNHLQTVDLDLTID